MLDERCLVIAGLNGAGKSRTLQALADSLGDLGVIIRIHEVIERFKSLIASRSDIAEMQNEVGPMAIDVATTKALGSIVGRDYSAVEWFGLELEPTLDGNSGWAVGESQSLVPHFSVLHSGLEYSSLEMGLGEYSVHVLFWLLWQYKDSPGKVILLDEPDAYIPPRTRMRLLALALQMARKFQWQLVITSHSSELIRAALQNDSLIVMTRADGAVKPLYSRVFGSKIARELIPQAPVDTMLFCEDESAAALLRNLIATFAGELAETSNVVWKDGDGYLRMLSTHLPRLDSLPIRFAFAFDGDMRNSPNPVPHPDPKRWPSVILPTDRSPDALFRESRDAVDDLSSTFGVSTTEMAIALEALEGEDDHEWVNKICHRFGIRTDALNRLARIWILHNESDSRRFCNELLESLTRRPGRG